MQISFSQILILFPIPRFFDFLTAFIHLLLWSATFVFLHLFLIILTLAIYPRLPF
jgi:hypothetical protein